MLLFFQMRCSIVTLLNFDCESRRLFNIPVLIWSTAVRKSVLNALLYIYTLLLDSFLVLDMMMYWVFLCIEKFFSL